MRSRAHLGWVDYLIIFGYFAVTVAVGFIVKPRVRSSTDYFMAGRAMPDLGCSDRFYLGSLKQPSRDRNQQSQPQYFVGWAAV